MPENANMLLPFKQIHSATVKAAVRKLAQGGTNRERGAVFTKPEIVAGILDLCHYVPEEDLLAERLLEPATGEGNFLLPAARRLLDSCKLHHGPPSEHVSSLSNAVRAIELHHSTYARTLARIILLLEEFGLNPEAAQMVARSWLKQDDFLLTSLDGKFDVVVGNPPYVRQERIPDALLREYRLRFATLYDRADLYVLFYERALDLLKPNGVLGFICANRWTKNKYGGPLREKISRHFNLDVYIDLQQFDAFQEQVDAYPAITIIRRAPQSLTRVVTSSRQGQGSLPNIFRILSTAPEKNSPHVKIVHKLSSGRAPWLVDTPEILETIRQLESRFPAIEETGIRVGIGVATGADAVFIGKYDELPVEKARLLPLVKAGDLTSNGIKWSGSGLVNPWMEDGTLADLNVFPRFRAYMDAHQTTLKQRHTARKNPRSWYRTIDRVYPELTSTPKLLIPDIKGEAVVALDEGQFYPHHNIYVLTSSVWDLRALQTLLRSSLALAFIAAYCVKMSGGFLRFQAQYLRRIRVPHWSSLSDLEKHRLVAVSLSENQEEVDDAVAEVLKLTRAQAELVRLFASSARVSGRAKG